MFLNVNYKLSLVPALEFFKPFLCVGTSSFCSGKESFGFKKLLELVWTLVYVFHRSMKKFHAVANFAKQVTAYVLFVKKLL